MEKGLDVFADTIDALRRRGVPHEVVVIGEGPSGDWFESPLPRARFVGFQRGEALARALASCDMLFNPSVSERSESRRFSQECGSPVRSRLSAHEQQQQQTLS